MRSQIPLLIIFFAAAVVFVEAQEDPHHCTYKAWLGCAPEVETLLRESEVKEFGPVGHGVTDPWKITLLNGGKMFYAAYKPIQQGRQRGYWESYQAEVAAYELDKMLGLHMVPPTVVRRINKVDADSSRGSLQHWVEDCSFYADVQDETPRTPSWYHELSRMKTFDVLINNEDRNAKNFFVCPEFHIILIDHSRAFTSSTKMLKMPKKLPASFDRRLVEKLENLTQENLEAHLKSVPFEDRQINLLRDGQIKAILKRRDGLLAHLQKLIEERGEGSVLFGQIQK
jgi:hypothetical protein